MSLLPGPDFYFFVFLRGSPAFFQLLSCHRDFTCVAQVTFSFNSYSLSAYHLRLWDTAGTRVKNPCPCGTGLSPLVPPFPSFPNFFLFTHSYLPFKSQLNSPHPRPTQSLYSVITPGHQICLSQHHAPPTRTRQCPLVSQCILCPQHCAWYLVNEPVNESVRE